MLGIFAVHADVWIVVVWFFTWQDEMQANICLCKKDLVGMHTFQDNSFSLNEVSLGVSYDNRILRRETLFR